MKNKVILKNKVSWMWILVFLVIGLTGGGMIFADGFIVVNQQGHIIPPPRPRPVPPMDFNPFLLEVKYHRVNVQINNQMAETSIDQVFYNPTGSRLEGYYLFPLPSQAVIQKFSMFVNGKELSAELLDAAKAKQIYEDIVRKQRDPALLEYIGKGVFKARIFPIEPYSEKRVKITYKELLEKENRTVEYIYPLNTEKFSAKPLSNVSIKVDIQSSEEIKNIFCPTHMTEIARKDPHHAVVGFEEKNTKPDVDFKLYYGTDNARLGFSLLSIKKEDEREGYFFLSMSPGYTEDENEISDKNITFVLDVSGSMAGKNLKQAQKALLFCIENLNKGDRFEIIRFSTEAEALFNGFAEANSRNRDKAREFVDNLKAIGGTNIDEALNLALKMEKQKDRPYMIVFITDGIPTIGETEEDALVKKITNANIANTRIFTFGIGNEINTHLLDKITELTRAYRSYISPEEDIEIKVSNFYSNVQSPILTDIKLNFGPSIKVTKAYPKDLPDLFKGSSITLLGRYAGEGDADITLTGKVKDKEKRFTFNAKNGFPAANIKYPGKNDFIPALWAARRVGYLLDQIRLHGSNNELIDEITQLARTYGIITPYTSYLIVEDEKENVRRQVISEDEQTLGQVAEEDKKFAENNFQDYSSMKSKTGAGSVQASRDFQQLNTAANAPQAQVGRSRLNYKDREGNTRNVTAQIKNIQGIAVYNTGKSWVDSRLQQQKKKQAVNRIQFGSSAYFKLLTTEPLSAPFLSLGKNVRFVLKNQVYEIHE